LENKELISSVKGIVSRLNSFGQRKEDVRNLFVMLFLLRWMRDEISNYAEYRDDGETRKLADKLNQLFSSNLNIRDIDTHIDEVLDRLKYSIDISALKGLNFTSSGHLLRDKRVTMEALVWLNDWGQLRLESRKDVSSLFEIILQETKTPQLSQFYSSKLLSQLVVAFARPRSGETILDPCVGEGGFLLEAHRAIEASDTDFLSQTPYFGFDVSGDALLIATVRFFLSGAFNFQLSKRSGLYDHHNERDTNKFDVVIAQPPAGVKREEYRHLAYERNFPVITKDVGGMFIQQALFSLKENGRAIVALPAHSPQFTMLF